MKKKSILTFIVVLVFGTAYSQKQNFIKPDYDKIETEIKDEHSVRYYPDLIQRYNDFDHSLNLEDYRYLYYGFFFDTGYVAYGNSNYSDSVNAIFEKNNLNQTDYERIIRFEKLALIEYPFSLRHLYGLRFGYDKSGNTKSAEEVDLKITMLVKAILSTGDGRSEKTAWHVLSISDEYSLISTLGYEFGGSQSLTRNTCDYLTIRKNKEHIKGLYFDVKKLFEKEIELFKK